MGNHIIFPQDEFLQQLQMLVRQMKIHHAEACRGVDRLRVASAQFDKQHVTHRKTVALLRESGEIDESREIEDWISLPKYKRIRKGKPSRLALTIFGCPANTEEQQSTGTPGTEESNNSGDIVMNPKEHVVQPLDQSSADQQTTGDGEQRPKVARGPPPIANHGPGFLKLTSTEQSEMRQLHNNLGHPDAAKFMSYLKQGGASEDILRAAKDFGISGRAASRHPRNLSFNHRVGVDLVTWRNKKGADFHFLHFIGEATLFHLGAERSQGAEEAIKTFEDLWVNWAGYPAEISVDPGSEFTSDAFAAKMQEAKIRAHMSAADSHWQLGRAEVHGCTIKRMLSRMDLEKGIESSLEFQAALRQAFMAKNSLRRSDGYSPQQSVLGVQPGCRDRKFQMPMRQRMRWQTAAHLRVSVSFRC